MAAGIYRASAWPNGGASRWEKHFTLKNGVAIYGGFAGTEDPANFNLDNRDFENNETILSGYHPGTFLIPPYRVYHIFYHPEGTDLDKTAVLDGFTISGGKADGDEFPHNAGGGMYNEKSSPKLVNLKFTNNEAGFGGGLSNNSFSNPELSSVTFSGNQAVQGGGIFNRESSNPVLSNVTISNNQAIWGGGIWNTASNPILTDVTIVSNFASNSGGGINNTVSSPTMTNMVICNNLASNNGGGMYNYLSEPNMTNVTVSSNLADYGGGIYNRESSPILLNVTIAGNKAYEDLGWGMLNDESSPIIRNSIFWANGGEGREIKNIGNSLLHVSFSIVQEGGWLFITDDPQIRTLADNGGATLTHAIPRNSPAYAIPKAAGDGNWNGAPDTDQRGFRRAMTGFRAIGAYEDAGLVQPGVLMLLLDEDE